MSVRVRTTGGIRDLVESIEQRAERYLDLVDRHAIEHNAEVRRQWPRGPRARSLRAFREDVHRNRVNMRRTLVNDAPHIRWVRLEGGAFAWPTLVVKGWEPHRKAIESEGFRG